MEITMEYYLVISTIMFFAGIYGFMTRRNMLGMTSFLLWTNGSLAD